MEIEGKVAVVTGAGENGSWRAIACRLARGRRARRGVGYSGGGRTGNRPPSAPFRPDEPLEHGMDAVETHLCGTVYGTRLAINACAARS